MQSKPATAYAKQGPNQSCKDILLCFAAVWLYTVFLYCVSEDTERKSQVSAAVEHTRSSCHKKKIKVEQICEETDFINKMQTRLSIYFL